MRTLEALHEEAMDLAELAFSARLSGDIERAHALFRESLSRETEVVEQVKARFDYEPTRSIVLLGAASLANNAGEFRLAQQLAYMALSGTPPTNVRQDLEQLLAETRMQLDAATTGGELSGAAIDLAIDGNAVVGGKYTEAEPFVSRVTSLARLFRRTYERVRGEPYRESGSPNVIVRTASRAFMSLTQPGSYRVTLRFGMQGQFPGMGQSEQAVKDLMEKLQVLQFQGPAPLERAIPDPAYRNNFVGLAKRLAPDGEHVSSVLLSANLEGRPLSLPLSREIQRVRVPLPARGRGEGKPVEVVGQLRHALKEAEEEESTIRLFDDRGKRHTIVVPTGMMNDIVGPLWDQRVRVTGTQVGKTIMMDNIAPANTEDA